MKDFQDALDSAVNAGFDSGLSFFEMAVSLRQMAAHIVDDLPEDWQKAALGEGPMPVVV